jgi:hypothetical protein
VDKICTDQKTLGDFKFTTNKDYGYLLVYATVDSITVRMISVSEEAHKHLDQSTMMELVITPPSRIGTFIFIFCCAAFTLYMIRVLNKKKEVEAIKMEET